VLWITLALNLLVAAGKIALGAATGMLAISADGLHSLTDGASNVVGLVGLHYGSQAPDAQHPYGHRRFETIAALVIAAFLLLTAWEMVQGVLERLGSDVLPEIAPATFLILAATLAINIAVNRYQRRAGERLNSTILLADAQHTGSDILVTLGVITSTLLVALTGLAWVDLLAALVVVVLIARAAWGIFRTTGSVLVDTAPFSEEELAALVASVPAVHAVLRARSRGDRDDVRVDIDVLVAPAMTAAEAEVVAGAIRDRITQSLPGVVEVEVHTAPDPATALTPEARARAQAGALGLGVHEVTLAGDTLELHVEVPAPADLGEAHARVSQLEQELRGELPGVARVVTHIEPLAAESPAAASDDPHCQTLLSQARALLAAQMPGAGWHDLHVRAQGDGYAMTAHAALPAAMSLDEAHDISEQAEALLRAQLPDLRRITIHTEPREAPPRHARPSGDAPPPGQP
jgi:cation diffusion facilitator family transporter